MPKYAAQSLSQQVPVDNPNPVQREVAAAPVNTFVDPGVSNLQRLGESLGMFNQGIMPLVQKQNQELDEQDKAQAIKDHMVDPNRVLPETASKAYQQTYMGLVGLDAAQKDNVAAMADLQKNIDDPGYDPLAAAQRIQSQGVKGLTSPYSIEAYKQGVSHIGPTIQQQWMQQQKENQRQAVRQDFIGQIGAVMDAGGTIEDKRKALWERGEQFVNLGIPRSETDQLVLHHAYAKVSSGDLGYMDLMMSKDTPSGVPLADRVDQGRATMEHAYRQGVALNEQKALKARQEGAVSQALQWDQQMQQVTPDTDAPSMVMAAFGGPGSFISTDNDVEQRINQIRTLQAKQAKQVDFERIALANPLMAHTMAAGQYSEEASKWRNKESDAIFAPVMQNPHDPNVLKQALDKAHAWMNTFPGEMLPGYKNLMQSGMSTLQSYTKDANGVGQTPPGFKEVYQEFLRDKAGNNKRLGQVIGSDEMDLLRVYDDAQQLGSSSETQAFQAVLNFKNRDPNEKHPVTQQAIEKLNSSVRDTATSMWKLGDGQNIDQLQDVALAKYKALRLTTNASEDTALKLAIAHVTENTVDVNGGKTFYPANVYVGLDKDKFEGTLNNIISDFQQRPDIKEKGISNIQAYTDRQGNVSLQDRDGITVLAKLSPEQIKAVYNDHLDALGQRAGDPELMQKLKRVIAAPDSPEAQSLSSLEVERLKPMYDLLSKRPGQIFTAAPDMVGENTPFQQITARAKANDNQRLQGIQELLFKTQKLYGSGQLRVSTSYPTDIMNPGGTNLRTIDYSQQQAAKGELGPSLTMLAEGMKLSTYRDQGGHRTIGIGYNIDAHGEEQATKDLREAGVPPDNVSGVLAGKVEITPDQAVTLFRNKMKNEYLPRARDGFGPGFDSLPTHVKAVLGDLAYTTGSIDKYQEAIKDIEAGDFQKAGQRINLTYRDSHGNSVRNDRRIDMYQQMLAGPAVWANYLDTTLKQTSRK
ncbi:MAG: hypothetical protein KGI54_08310 [Pseudomonadota bacterium]|nr:hypothetical protein [Pseudomonadota bacterium]